MTKKQIIERLSKIESFLLLSDDEYANSYKVGWTGSAISNLIEEIKAKG